MIQRLYGTILETNPPHPATPQKWNYLLCRDFYGEPLHYIAAPVVHACRLSCIIPPHFRHRTRVPVAGVDVECSPRHPGSRLQHGLAGSRPKMCQVHVALLGSRAPCNETVHSMPSKRVRFSPPCINTSRRFLVANWNVGGRRKGGHVDC